MSVINIKYTVHLFIDNFLHKYTYSNAPATVRVM